MTKTRIVASLGWMFAAFSLTVSGRLFVLPPVDADTVVDSPSSTSIANVYAAVSLTEALRNIRNNCTDTPYYNASTNVLDSSGILAGYINGSRTIPSGVPTTADVFISADIPTLQNLDPAYVYSSTRGYLLKNTLTLIQPSGGSVGIGSVDALVTTDGTTVNINVDKVFIGDPSLVPAGNYAKILLQSKTITVGGVTQTYYDVLNNAGKLDQSSSNVRAVLNSVANSSDSNVVGFVYETDFTAASGLVDEIRGAIAAADQPNITYSVAVVKASSNAGTARSFENYLFSSSCAQNEFTNSGFTTISSTDSSQPSTFDLTVTPFP